MIISSKKWSETVESKKMDYRGKIFLRSFASDKIRVRHRKIDKNVIQHVNNDGSQK